MSSLILTTGDAARRLSLSSEFVRRLAKEGKITATRTASGQYFFEAQEIERFRVEREQQRQQKSALIPNDQQAAGNG